MHRAAVQVQLKLFFTHPPEDLKKNKKTKYEHARMLDITWGKNTLLVVVFNPSHFVDFPKTKHSRNLTHLSPSA